MMATAVVLCPPTPRPAGEIVTIFAPGARAAAAARAILPLDLAVVAAPRWPVARATLGVSCCLVVRTPPPPPVLSDAGSDALALLADVRRAHPRLAVVFQTGDDAARAHAAAAGLAHEVVAWDDARSTLWSRVQSALTSAALETAAGEARTAAGLPPAVRLWLDALWAHPTPPRSVAEACTAARVTPAALAHAWPAAAPPPELAIVWTVLLRTAVVAARGESWRAAAEATGMDPRALRHALARGARLRAGELGAPVVPATDNPHARLRRAFRRTIVEPLLGA